MPLYTIETRGELHPFLAHEFLLTNGAGGMASSSLVGCNTRRYHGLLCGATVPPVGRVMALNRVGELLSVDGRSDFAELSVNQFRNNLHPRGDRYLQRFELGRTAAWEFEAEGLKVRKELLLCWRRNVIGLRYSVDPGEQRADRQFELHLLPFVSLRDFHSLLQGGGASFDTRAQRWEMSVSRNGHTLNLRADAGEFAKSGDWWYGHTYPIETDRGQDDSEDLFAPGRLIFKSQGKATVTVWASLDAPAELLDWQQEVRRRPEKGSGFTIQGSDEQRQDTQHSAHSTQHSPAIRRLLRAADDFVVARKRPDGKPGTTIIAGYPWFADWGRDTMISLPGLLLVPRRFDEAAQVLTLFAQYVSEGMIPNRFDDYTSEPSYNTVDASLWFVHACFEYLRHSEDKATFERELRPACRAIVEGYRKGTRYNIHMEADGLIAAGDENTQLTWMDAKCGGVVFTPRHGKAVEINALWYNALRLLAEDALAKQVAASFVKAFWYNPFRGLYDVVWGAGADGYRDAQLRPNQIFAVSLPHSPLNRDQQHAVVEVVRRELLTAYGLRTLNRADPNYCGHKYCGPAFERDRSYHNGIVWPWLIGPFLEAYLRVNEFSADAKRQARVWLQPLIDHMNSHCVGQIAECFTGDEPHRPVACPAQAWSVAEVLRLAAMLGT